METNEMILKELQEIKNLLKQLLEAQIQTNDNLVTAAEEISDQQIIWGH